MAKNGPKGKGREGMVKKRSQTDNKKTSLWVKRNSNDGKFMDDKTTGGPFKGVRKEHHQRKRK